MIRTWLAIGVLVAIVAGGTLALLIDWPSVTGSCDATWTRCAP